ncbi:hypothetical protein AG0111_0g2542 [Alternaria gaisen]|uniref:Uncharacterized protein n=1 Tax=Alternaria gaisen TaxID=167740 RepID=A0ACB6FVL6_9PLEO|nr:hypothetical protein AG0111_0g2542 [Alternaria gaisen]RYO64273.1 hypothetical protein AA0116_g4041 [Alternaria tenuissima]
MANQSNKPYTLQLSTKICDRLPRELRDRIYSLLDLDQETKRSKPIDDFIDDQCCEQFSRECLLWYYENVPQMLYRPFNYQDMKHFMRLYPQVKKIPGLIIVLDAGQPDFEFEALTHAMDELKATGHFDDLNRDFKVRVYIDIAHHAMWRSMNPNVEQAILSSQRILQYFSTRVEDAMCFVRLMEAEDTESRDVGMDITESMEEPMDEILEIFGCLVVMGMECSPPRWIEKPYRMCHRKTQLLQL